jgi:hypothetical protein
MNVPDCLPGAAAHERWRIFRNGRDPQRPDQRRNGRSSNSRAGRVNVALRWHDVRSAHDPACHNHQRTGEKPRHAVKYAQAVLTGISSNA